MSISRQNLSVIIVSFKSEYVIHLCINSIDEQIEIIVVENSNNEKLKFDLEKKYKNVRCILSSTNIGMGAGNNLGIIKSNTHPIHSITTIYKQEFNPYFMVFY